MCSHNGANISSQIPSTSSACQILGWVQSISVDHEVTISQVNFWSFRFVLSIEKFWQCSFLDNMYRIVIKPRRIRWNDDVMSLFSYVVVLYIFFISKILSVAVLAGLSSLRIFSAFHIFVEIMNNSTF